MVASGCLAVSEAASGLSNVTKGGAGGGGGGEGDPLTGGVGFTPGDLTEVGAGRRAPVAAHGRWLRGVELHRRQDRVGSLDQGVERRPIERIDEDRDDSILGRQ